MSGTLSLAASIAGMDHAQLRTLLGCREVGSPGSISDPLGLALELLRPDSISRAVSTVDRGGLAALAALGAGRPPGESEPALAELRLRGLVGLDAHSGALVPLPEVSAALDRALGVADAGGRAETETEAEKNIDALGSFSAHAGDTSAHGDRLAPGSVGAAIPPAPSADSADASRWYGQALSSVRRVAALLRILAVQPAKLSRKGLVTATSLRALADATHSDIESTGQLVAVMQSAGLAVPHTEGRPGTPGALLIVSQRATGWLADGYPERWLEIAAALASDLDAHLRRALEIADGDLAVAASEVLAHEYPLLPGTALAAATEYAATAEVLGLTVHGRLSPTALPLLAGDAPTALSIATRDIPPPAPGVYVQPDLTVIVPGPLQPADEQALSEFTETEQLGAAASLRLTSTSLARALRRGHTTAGIREVLSRLSLTGIPQPLDYMLGDLDRTRAEATQPIRLARPNRFDELLQAASDRAFDAEPQLTEVQDTTEGDAVEALVERVFAAAQATSDAGDLTRRLELAIRDRTPVQVTAAAGSDERTFTLLPVALTGGRLRATDQVAGVERTLPVTAIIGVVPA